MRNAKSFRIIVLVVLLVCTSFLSYADMVDLVVLLDVSESMFPYYDATVDYLLKDIIQEHLHPGDTFHLISFADLPEREINRNMKSRDDVEAILDRISLLHPLGQYTDLILALRYLYQYTSDLSLRTKKNILILTDGIHDPPPGSSYPALTAEQIALNKKIAKEIAENFKREGWDINLVEFPRTLDENGNEDETGIDIYDTLSDSLDVTVLEYTEEKNGTLSHEATGAPSLIFPTKIIRGNTNATIPFLIQNYRDKKILVKLDEILYNGSNILISPVYKRINADGKSKLRAKVQLPEMEKGEYQLPIELVFSDNLRVFPRSGVISYKYTNLTFSWLKYAGLVILLIILVFVLIRFVIIPIRISISTSAEREQYQKSSIGISKNKKQDKEQYQKEFSTQINTSLPASKSGKVDLMSLSSNKQQTSGVPLLNADSPKSDTNKIPLSSLSNDSSALLSSKKIQHYPIEMRVLGQNPLIGNRNIHWIGQKNHSIGGKGSSFIIFLYPVPANIASISFTPGKGFIFTPSDYDYFPQLKKPINDCINKQIILKTKHGEELVLIFHEWISPLERINRILNLTRHAGSEEYLPGF